MVNSDSASGNNQSAKERESKKREEGRERRHLALDSSSLMNGVGGEDSPTSELSQGPVTLKNRHLIF